MKIRIDKWKMAAIVAISLVFVVDNSYAQAPINRIKGVMNVSAGGLISHESYGGFIGENYRFSNMISLDSRLNIMGGKHDYTKFTKFTLDNQMVLNITSIYNMFYLEGLIGCQLGLDNMKSKVEDKSKTTFMLMGEMGFKVTYYINTDWSIFAEAKETFGLSKTGSISPLFGLGGSWMLPGMGNKANRKFN